MTVTAWTISVSDLNFFISQIELPVETVTAPTPQSQESRRAHKNPVHTKLFVEPWNELPDITFASPGGRGQQGPGVTSILRFHLTGCMRQRANRLLWAALHHPWQTLRCQVNKKNNIWWIPLMVWMTLDCLLYQSQKDDLELLFVTSCVCFY